MELLVWMVSMHSLVFVSQDGPELLVEPVSFDRVKDQGSNVIRILVLKFMLYPIHLTLCSDVSM